MVKRILLMFGAAWLTGGIIPAAGPASHPDLASLAQSEPVGLVGEMTESHGERYLRLPARLHDFAKGEDVGSIRISNGVEFTPDALLFSSQDGILSFLALSPVGPGGIATVSFATETPQLDAPVHQLPHSSGGQLLSVVKAGLGFAELDRGPIVAEYDGNGMLSKRVVLDEGDNARPPIREEMWAFSARHHSFVIYAGRMSLVKYPDFGSPRCYIGNI